MASNSILLPVADQSPSTAGSLRQLSSLFPAAPELLSLTVGILLGATIFSYRRRRSDHQRQDLESIAVAREPKDQLPTPPPHPLLSLPQSPPPPLYDAQSTKPPPPPSAFTDLPPPLRTTLHSQVGPPVTSTDLASRPWRRVTYPLPRHPCDPRATEVHVTQGVQFFLQPESLLPIDGNGDGDAAASEKQSQQQQQQQQPRQARQWRKRRIMTFEAVARDPDEEESRDGGGRRAAPPPSGDDAQVAGIGAGAGAAILGFGTSPPVVQESVVVNVVSEADMWAKMRGVEIEI